MPIENILIKICYVHAMYVFGCMRLYILHISTLHGFISTSALRCIIYGKMICPIFFTGEISFQNNRGCQVFGHYNKIHALCSDSGVFG